MCSTKICTPTSFLVAVDLARPSFLARRSRSVWTFGKMHTAVLSPGGTPETDHDAFQATFQGENVIASCTHLSTMIKGVHRGRCHASRWWYLLFLGGFVDSLFLMLMCSSNTKPPLCSDGSGGMVPYGICLTTLGVM